MISNNDHYSINKAAKIDGIVSTLTVKGLLEVDFGDYVCSISNGHGEDAFNVTLLRVCKLSDAGCPIINHLSESFF